MIKGVDLNLSMNSDRSIFDNISRAGGEKVFGQGV